MDIFEYFSNINFTTIIISAIFWGIITWLIGRAKGFNGFFYGFCLGIIGFIIVLCLKNKNISANQIVNPINVKSDNQNDKYANLEKLYNLKENGTLTEEEYEKEKKKIMNL